MVLCPSCCILLERKSAERDYCEYNNTTQQLWGAMANNIASRGTRTSRDFGDRPTVASKSLRYMPSVNSSALITANYNRPLNRPLVI